MSVRITLVSGSGSVLAPLVFDVDNIKKLRALGICGILTGTLPTATQQNIFLSVPLRLMPEEAMWLYINGHAHFQAMPGPTSAMIDRLLQESRDGIYRTAEERLAQSFALQREYKLEQQRLKLQQLGINKATAAKSDKDNAREAKEMKLMEASLFIETPSRSSLIPDIHERFGDSQPGIDRLLCILIAQFSNWDNYLLFQALKNEGYVLSPGARFGGKYIAYPGDPLRFHSHLVIRDALHYKNEPIDFLELAAGARLGTTVKKLWVIGAPTKESGCDKELISQDFVSFYSVEWAGFG